MPFSSNEGARIHWRGHGLASAPPLVLLHSIGTDLAIYDEIVPLLEPDHNILRVDLRGHGASEATAGEYSLALLARDVLAVLADAAVTRALVCGTSLGGMVAMELARLAPQHIAGLVLANTSARMDPALWPERIATVQARGIGAILEGWAGRHLSEPYMHRHPARVATLERAFAATDPGGYAGCAAAIRDMDLVAHLPAIAVPTLVIAGEHDVATPLAGHGDRIAAAIPGAELAIIPAGHLACIERPDLFSHAIRSLAARCTPPG